MVGRGLRPAGILIEGDCRDVELPRHPSHERLGRLVEVGECGTGMAQQGELHGVAEAVRIAEPLGHEIPVGARQDKQPGQGVGIGWDAQKTLALLLGQELSVWERSSFVQQTLRNPLIFFNATVGARVYRKPKGKALTDCGDGLRIRNSPGPERAVDRGKTSASKIVATSRCIQRAATPSQKNEGMAEQQTLISTMDGLAKVIGYPQTLEELVFKVAAQLSAGAARAPTRRSRSTAPVSRCPNRYAQIRR